MIDKTKAIKGWLNIKCLDSNNKVIDSFDDHNLVVDLARESMADTIAGCGDATPINKFVFGTEGHKDGNLLTPKVEGTDFDETRTQLFSEESAGTLYEINFTPSGVAGTPATIDSETDGTVVPSTVNVTREGTSAVKYEILIPKENANDSGVVAYTEAGLSTANGLFSMRAFPAKIKEDTVSVLISWTILF